MVALLWDCAVSVVLCLLACLCDYLFVMFFFFKQKTAYEMRISDWSSDVCSSDLGAGRRGREPGNTISQTLQAGMKYAQNAALAGILTWGETIPMRDRKSVV